MAPSLLSDPVDHLARVYVNSRALQSRELVRHFDAVAGTHLSEHHDELASVDKRPTGRLANDLMRFRAFAEAALWDGAPPAVKVELIRLIRAAVKYELPTACRGLIATAQA